MTFFAFGLNHQQAPVRLRERFALDEEAIRTLYRTLPRTDAAELIVVSTCNRTEVYLYGTEQDVMAVQAVLGMRAGLAWPREQAFAYRDEEAVRHVLQVTAGLRSLVLGDAQIFAQVKEAYRVAVEEDAIAATLHRLMHTAFRTAKRVINETALTAGAASVAGVAVALARTHFGDEAGLAGRRVLLVGAGQMNRLALEALHGLRDVRVTLTNRTAERAHALAAPAHAEVVAWADRHAAAAEADVVLVATAADAPVLTAEALPPRAEGHSPALLLDISVPRNIDPAVDALPGYVVRDLDFLNQWIVEAEATRRDAAPAARAVCEEMMGEFVGWVFHHQALQPAVEAIRDTFESIRRQEIERHHHRLAEVDFQELDRITSSILQKLLAVPVVRLKSVNPDSIDYVRGIKLLHALFSRPGCDADQPAMPQMPAEGRALYIDRAVAPAPASCPFTPPSVDFGEGLTAEERLEAAFRAQGGQA